MSTFLVLSVWLHDGRYHGAGDWPPSPARLFQALVAGAGVSGPLNSAQAAALQWMEAACLAPIIAAPHMINGQKFENFVPNNDLDAEGGDPRNLGAIRTKKQIRPRIFPAATPFHYAWEILAGEESSIHLQILHQLAGCLYQFGRGVDLAWADVELMDQNTLEAHLSRYLGTVHRPSAGSLAGTVLACPVKGSFLSLERRYAANAHRFAAVQVGQTFSQSFQQPPKARFRLVGYDCPPVRRVFELRPSSAAEKYSPWPLQGVCQLVKLCRDNAEQRLIQAFPSQTPQIQRWLIGRRADGANGGSPSERIRLVPLASIGHVHADLQVRRVLVEVLAGCPLPARDVFWAFHGLQLSEGAGHGPILTATSETKMLEEHVAEEAASVWRSVTPVALPESTRRRRIEPSRRLDEAKPASEKRVEQERAAHAVREALRHAEVMGAVSEIVVQREPFHSHGERVDAFAETSRFPKERLWHVKIRFTKPRTGLLVIGDGRFSGLGVMVPLRCAT